jgi:quercetin dioxygenase-like cupin family protein
MPDTPEKRTIELTEVPAEPNRYWTRVVINDADRQEIPGGKGWNYISPDVCGALTINAGMFELPAGASTGNKELHSHSQEEFSYILSGRGWIAVEDEVHHFGPGDFVFVPSFARHGWGNDGPEPVKVLFWRPIKPEPANRAQPFDLRRFTVKLNGG